MDWSSWLIGLQNESLWMERSESIGAVWMEIGG